CQKYYSTPYSF
nr:immunoglobulin light chain junction region [Macaca mulatta]